MSNIRSRSLKATVGAGAIIASAALVLSGCSNPGGGGDAPTEDPRARALLGNVRTTATELAHRLGRAGRDTAAVREAVRDVIWGALTAGACEVAALRAIVETLAPLLDAE